MQKYQNWNSLKKIMPHAANDKTLNINIQTKIFNKHLVNIHNNSVLIYVKDNKWKLIYEKEIFVGYKPTFAMHLFIEKYCLDLYNFWKVNCWGFNQLLNFKHFPKYAFFR